MTTSTHPVAPPLAGLEPIGLDELAERAALQTRRDRKYLVPVDALAELLAGLEPGARVLQVAGRRRFRYESVYFDTRRLDCYLAAAHGRRRRFKVRTRCYLDTDDCFVEVKTHGPRGVTVKARSPYAPGGRATLDDGGWAFARAALGAAAVPPPAGALVPTLVTRYDRVTVLLPSTDARATVDTDLVWQAADGGPGRALGRLAVVETKTGATPSSLDRLLWRSGRRPVRLSKYGTGMAALHPDLPAARWRRTLDRHMLPTGG